MLVMLKLVIVVPSNRLMSHNLAISRPWSTFIIQSITFYPIIMTSFPAVAPILNNIIFNLSNCFFFIITNDIIIFVLVICLLFELHCLSINVIISKTI